MNLLTLKLPLNRSSVLPVLYLYKRHLCLDQKEWAEFVTHHNRYLDHTVAVAFISCPQWRPARLRAVGPEANHMIAAI